MDQDYPKNILCNGNHHYSSTSLKCYYIFFWTQPHTHARIGTKSFFAHTTCTFFRSFNLTLVHLTSHNLLISVFTLWPFISMPFFHLLNVSSSSAKPLFLQTEHDYQNQVVRTNKPFLISDLSIDKAFRTIANSINSRGLRTEPWCTPTLTLKASLPIPFTSTLIIVSTYIAFFHCHHPSTSQISRCPPELLEVPYHTLPRHFSYAFFIYLYKPSTNLSSLLGFSPAIE